MTDSSQEELLRYYLSELTYLREMGAAFSDTHPKVASRLELSTDESPDPHVERLIESFAFLTARIQRNLDQQFPEITTALLDILYPHYLSPIPSLTVARFQADPEQGKLTTGYEIPAHTPLYATARGDPEARGADRLETRFRTCYPVVLWPLEVIYAGLESTDQYEFLDRRSDVVGVIRIRLEVRGLALEELELDRIRFYLNQELKAASDLYELIFAHLSGVFLLMEGSDRPVDLGVRSVTPVGFESHEQVLPYPNHSHPGYRLLQEYFTFPRKFLFMDVSGLESRGLSGSAFELLLLLGKSPEAELTLDADTFALGCTPVANLFPRTSDPIRLDHLRSEYRLRPDVHREGSTEVHTILSVSASSDETAVSRFLRPYYSFDHQAEHEQEGSFWFARRISTGRRDVPGTEMMLSFVDLDFDPRTPATEVVYAHTLCTNRRLAEQLPAGAGFQTEFGGPFALIEALHKPTPQLDPPLGGGTRWRLVSHLSLNHLSLQGGEEGLKAFREILQLYGIYDNTSVQRQILGIREIHCRPAMERLGQEAWRGFIRGTEVRIVFDESAFPGANAFLFASVLRHFLALYASVNSFTRLVAESTRRPGEIWKRWPALAGTREIL